MYVLVNEKINVIKIGKMWEVLEMLAWTLLLDVILFVYNKC